VPPIIFIFIPGTKGACTCSNPDLAEGGNPQPNLLNSELEQEQHRGVYHANFGASSLKSFALPGCSSHL
jgi:hypothetical protein